MNQRLKWTGVFSGLGSALCFSTLNVTVKISETSMPGSELMFARGLMGALILTPFIFKELPKILVKTSGLVWLRFLSGALAVYLLFINIQICGSGAATALGNLSAIFVLGFSIFFLREKLNPQQWFGVALVMSGSFVLHSPAGLSIPSKSIVIGLLGAFSGGIAMASLKQVTDKYSHLLIVWGFCLFCGVLAVIMPDKPWHLNSMHSFLLLFFAGTLGIIGQLLLTFSYHQLPAAIASTLGLSGLLWTVLLESIYFKQIPHWLACLSYFVIFIGLYVLQWTRQNSPVPRDSLANDP